MPSISVFDCLSSFQVENLAEGCRDVIGTLMQLLAGLVQEAIKLNCHPALKIPHQRGRISHHSDPSAAALGAICQMPRMAIPQCHPNMLTRTTPIAKASSSLLFLNLSWQSRHITWPQGINATPGRCSWQMGQVTRVPPRTASSTVQAAVSSASQVAVRSRTKFPPRDDSYGFPTPFGKPISAICSLNFCTTSSPPAM